MGASCEARLRQQIKYGKIEDFVVHVFFWSGVDRVRRICSMGPSLIGIWCVGALLVVLHTREFRLGLKPMQYLRCSSRPCCCAFHTLSGVYVLHALFFRVSVLPRSCIQWAKYAFLAAGTLSAFDEFKHPSLRNCISSQQAISILRMYVQRWNATVASGRVFACRD